MHKKFIIVSLIGLFLIMGGTLLIKQSGEQSQSGMLGLPEGYEEPASRVEKLKIDGSVSKYYDENLELVAFGPGSGWLKFRTRDGISPTLSFKGITQRDIQKFNKFSKSIGLPVRVEFANNVLRISSDEIGDEPIHLADITAEKIGANSIMNKGFFNKDVPTRLVIRKDQSGKVKLVAVDTPKGAPGVAPEEKDLVIAKKEEKKK